MSVSEVYRGRYNLPGYVYICGSLIGRVHKVGMTKNIVSIPKRLRYQKVGNLTDWELLYYVWAEKSGTLEHDARRPLLALYRDPRFYAKDGKLQKSREILRCSYGVVVAALKACLTDQQKKDAWESKFCDKYQFLKSVNVPTPIIYPLTTASIPKQSIFVRNIQSLGLLVQVISLLRRNGIVCVGDLVVRSKTEIREIPGMGSKAFSQITGTVEALGLHFDMEISGWPPEKLDDLSQKAEPLFVAINKLGLT